ncbi:group II intron maturase-specific domain-containing protein [Streptomyces sp. NPDC006463]|uniref:group II intron maturase-specific domain-containing protein n=1 Tax=Streptomyces sp. NPDC006463 TaxID=3364746 RepID=UPI0036BD2808
MKRKIKSLTLRLSHLDYRIALIRINQIQRGWANYFEHGSPSTPCHALAPSYGGGSCTG